MELDIPLVFIGEAPAVEETGGTLLHNLSSIHVKALPGDIPHEVQVDVSVLEVARRRHPRSTDLSLNRDLVHVLTDGETLVATVVPPRIEEEPEPVVVEGEELEGEASRGCRGRRSPGEDGEPPVRRGRRFGRVRRGFVLLLIREPRGLLGANLNGRSDPLHPCVRQGSGSGNLAVGTTRLRSS